MSEDTNDEPMEKNARIEVGKTPSPYSGKPSEMIKKGEAVTEDEEPEEDSLSTECNKGLFSNTQYIGGSGIQYRPIIGFAEDDTDFDLI